MSNEIMVNVQWMQHLVSVEAIKQWDTSEVTTMRNLFFGLFKAVIS